MIRAILRLSRKAALLALLACGLAFALSLWLRIVVQTTRHELRLEAGTLLFNDARAEIRDSWRLFVTRRTDSFTALPFRRTAPWSDSWGMPLLFVGVPLLPIAAAPYLRRRQSVAPTGRCPECGAAA